MFVDHMARTATSETGFSAGFLQTPDACWLLIHVGYCYMVATVGLGEWQRVFVIYVRLLGVFSTHLPASPSSSTAPCWGQFCEECELVLVQ